MKTVLIILATWTVGIAQATPVAEEIISRQVSLALLGQLAADVEQNIDRANAAGSSLSAMHIAIRRFVQDPLWATVENDDAETDAQQKARDLLERKVRDLLEKVRAVEKTAYGQLDGEWIRSSFVTVSRQQLVWNSYRKNWSTIPNQYGGELQKHFISELEAQRIRIVRLKHIVERASVDQGAVQALVARSNGIASSDDWVEFLSPKREVVLRVQSWFEDAIGALSDAIDVQWLALHPGLAEKRDNARREIAVAKGIANAERTARIAQEQNKCLAKKVSEQEMEISAARAEVGELNKKLNRQINTLEDRLDRASDDFHTATGTYPSW